MKASFQITIPKRASECFHCKTVFTSGQEIKSQLKGEDDEWIRQDGCSACFVPIESAVVWKQVIRAKDKELPENQDHIAKALGLLQKLTESELPEEHEEAFLLALYLVRKKVLAHRVKMGLYENMETGEMFLIPKINFSTFSAHSAQLRLQEKI